MKNVHGAGNKVVTRDTTFSFSKNSSEKHRMLWYNKKEIKTLPVKTVVSVDTIFFFVIMCKTLIFCEFLIFFAFLLKM
jgi:hypothetical protein